jgi:hypothetical protein
MHRNRQRFPALANPTQGFPCETTNRVFCRLRYRELVMRMILCRSASGILRLEYGRQARPVEVFRAMTRIFVGFAR